MLLQQTSNWFEDLKALGFSRADKAAKLVWALAPKGM